MKSNTNLVYLNWPCGSLRGTNKPLAAQKYIGSNWCLKIRNSNKTYLLGKRKDKSLTDINSIKAQDRRSLQCDIVTAALRAACGREVKFDDAIRLGKFVSDKPPRPILVKLCSPWDKRIVVGGAWRLKDNDQLRRVYIRDDLPLPERRRNLLERLQYRATRDGHTVSVSSDGVLVIDGINTFSLQDGFIQPRDHGGRQWL